MAYALYNADCLDIMRGLADASVDAIITDPPYGIDYQSARRIDKSERLPRIANDGKPFIWWLYDAYRVTKEGGTLICFCRWDVQDVFKMAIECAGYKIRSQVIWDREAHGLGDVRTVFAPRHDVIWYATKGRFEFPANRPMSVVRSKRIAADALTHPNEKPVDLMRQLVTAVSRVGGTVLDPFMGSGTTIVACEQEGRVSIGIEKDTEHGYFAAAQKRIDAIQPRLEGMVA